MAAIEGFELSISTGDIVVGLGLVDGVAVAAVTLDTSALGIGDGTNDIVYNGSVVTAEATVSGTNIKLGEFTETTAVASAPSLNGRGDVVAASA